MTLMTTLFIIMLSIAVVIMYFKVWWGIVKFFFRVGWKLAMIFGFLIVFSYFIRACGL